jgi:DNA topoisomerase-1
MFGDETCATCKGARLRPEALHVFLGEAKEKGDKPKRSPLPSGISQDSIELDTALNLLNLPLKIGNHPETEEEIVLGIGRFGPYLRYQGKFTSIPKSIDPFSVDLNAAVELIASKKVKAKPE